MSSSDYSHVGVEPVAIVGMACRLPGKVDSPDKLWHMLINERSGQCDVPADRWNVEAFYHPQGAEVPGHMSTRGGYFLQENIRAFDPSFFGINNKEASYMDPQQRKLLEVVFECFESAGVRLEDASGSSTGCYVGNFTMDHLVMQSRDPDYYHRFAATGMGTTILANRISHVFNLKGPSMVLDTACSSSLFCLHTAVQALRNRDCDAAVVAGANLIQSPEQHLATMKAGVLSATSTSHTFDAAADGYGRADGVGALYIKRLPDAIRDGDPIRSIIRGTAVNSSGRTPGITLPSATAQEAVIRQAHHSAQIDLNETLYVECHGTGTQVGDPIEVEAVSKAFAGRNSDQRVLIGGVKPNLGHSEAASGISAIIKGTLALENGIIPATRGVRRINPKIKCDEWNIDIVRSNTPWPSRETDSATPWRAGISSFGYGGANAHVVLERYVDPSVSKSTPAVQSLDETVSSVLPQNRRFILPFSASSIPALRQRVDGLGQMSLDIANLAYTLSDKRSRLEIKGYLISSQDTLTNDLRSTNLLSDAIPNEHPKDPMAFVFTGQGAQWATMGKGLIEHFDIARSSLERMDAALQALPHPPPWSLLEALCEPAQTSKINEATLAQPACTALQVMLVDLLRSWNLTPVAVIGHSSGEIAAGYASGLLTAEQAIIVAYYRGHLVGKLSGDGQMMAVGIGHAEAQRLIDEAGLAQAAVVACVNSPISVTLSGDASAIQELETILKEKQIFHRKLLTDGKAYHSHHMRQIAQEYEDSLTEILASIAAPGPDNKVAMFSSVSGSVLDSPLDGKYWRTNLESSVLFSPALESLHRHSRCQIIEIGPHATLKGPINQLSKSLGIKSSENAYYSVMNRGTSSATSVLTLAGNLFLSGCDISLRDVNTQGQPSYSDREGHPTMVLNMPSYPWTYDEEELWEEPRSSLEYRQRAHPHHELLGSLVPGGNQLNFVWRNIIKLEYVPWLTDHRLNDTIIFPGAGYIAMGIEAISQMYPKMGAGGAIELQNLSIANALVVSGDSAAPPLELFTSLTRRSLSGSSVSETWWDLQITSVNDGVSTAHASGLVRLNFASTSLQKSVHIQANEMKYTAIRNWYTKLAQEGLNFGPQFRTLDQLRISRTQTELQTWTTVPLLTRTPGRSTDGVSEYVIHPITIDAMLQGGILATTPGVISSLKAQVPVMIERAVFRKSPDSDSIASVTCDIMAAAKVTGFGQTQLMVDIVSGENEILAQIEGVQMMEFTGGSDDDELINRHPMLRVAWAPEICNLDRIPFGQSPETPKTPLNTRMEFPVDQWYKEFLAALDLIAHKDPSLRILCIDNEDDSHDGWGTSIDACAEVLRVGQAFPRCKSLSIGRVREGGIMVADFCASDARDALPKWTKATEDDEFDLVLSTRDQLRYSDVTGLLRTGGLVLSYSRSSAFTKDIAGDASISRLPNDPAHLVLVTKGPEPTTRPMEGEECTFIIVEHALNAELGESVAKSFQQRGCIVRRLRYDQLCQGSIPTGSKVIVTVEHDAALLSVVNKAEIEQLKFITDNAAIMLWISKADLMNCTNPDVTLMGGLSRALMLEQPSLKLYWLDVDGKSSDVITAEHAVRVVTQRPFGNIAEDFEFVQKDGTLYVSRFIPDERLNNKFRQRLGQQASEVPLAKVGDFSLVLQELGQFDTLAFKEERVVGALEPDHVQVEVKAIGLNAKDMYALRGKTETRDATSGLEFSGIITKVGSSVTKFTPGDRVVAMAPHHTRRFATCPEWACVKMLDSEDFNAVSVLGVVYSTAIYGLIHRAQLKAGESVLIHSGAGGLGFAAIQIAKMLGATVFATVGTPQKHDYLVNDLGVDPARIFSSRDSQFRKGILAQTQGEGVDVVLNSLTGDLLHDSWAVCKEFGRFVEVGKLDLANDGNLSMRHFLKATTFTAFDLTALYYSSSRTQNAMWSSLLEETMRLYRSGAITDTKPLRVFDVSEITQAFYHFASKDRIGKVAVSFTSPQSKIRLLPLKYETQFASEKSYLLVGCLGGLGGTIAKWMLSRGAKKFVFLGRSGIDRVSARDLVDDLRLQGADVIVVRGDVGSKADVQRAVDGIDGVIGGIIQAAMGLSEALFTSMSDTAWHTGIDPKLQGTWNLHNAVAARESTDPLDFFMMTSSISGSVGTATESNYCTGNYFLDMFARYRKQRGLRATSLGLGMISEVGYLHENPEIEALLLRKGIQAINQEELLQIVDLALHDQEHVSADLLSDPLAASHVLTGLEPHGLKALRKKGFEGGNLVFSDPRSALLSSALGGDETGRSTAATGSYSKEVTTALLEEGDNVTMDEVVTMLTLKKFSNLTLVAVPKLDTKKKLLAYGMDSMLAAEFRSWIYRVFKSDVPFFEMLSEKATLLSIIGLINEKVALLDVR